MGACTSLPSPPRHPLPPHDPSYTTFLVDAFAAYKDDPYSAVVVRHQDRYDDLRAAERCLHVGEGFIDDASVQQLVRAFDRRLELFYEECRADPSCEWGHS